MIEYSSYKTVLILNSGAMMCTVGLGTIQLTIVRYLQSGPDLDCCGPWAISLHGPGQSKCERRGGGVPLVIAQIRVGGSFLQLIHSELAMFLCSTSHVLRFSAAPSKIINHEYHYEHGGPP